MYALHGPIHPFTNRSMTLLVCGMGAFYSILPQSPSFLRRSHWPRRARIYQWRRSLYLGPPPFAEGITAGKRCAAAAAACTPGRRFLKSKVVILIMNFGDRFIITLPTSLRFKNLPSLPKSPPPASCDSSIPFNSNGTTPPLSV